MECTRKSISFGLRRTSVNNVPLTHLVHQVQRNFQHPRDDFRRYATHILQKTAKEPWFNGSKTWSGRFMITAQSPSNTQYRDIISRIPKQDFPIINIGKAPSVVVLTTPSFATWLEEDLFISNLLRRTLFAEKSEYTSFLEVDLVSAIVDRLPPPKYDGSAGEEGFAVLYGPQPFVLPEYYQDSSPTPGRQASIIFNFNRHFDTGGTGLKESSAQSPRDLPKTIVLPLAKTIFQNGKDSTLIASKWQKAEREQEFKKIGQSEKASEKIIALPYSGALVPHVPMIPLTEPRLIVSGMGNIVRRLALEDADKTNIPASQELEANISDYFESEGIPPRAVSVWAEISQPTWLRQRKRERKSGGITEKKYQNLSDFRYTDSSVHRVLSGGGGWGLKQGLVSLDPQSELDFLPQTQEDTSENAGLSEQEAIGEIARPGSFIQYFLAMDSPPKQVEVEVQKEVKEELSPQKKRKQKKKQSQKHLQNLRLRDQSLVLGVTPSSIDEIPDAFVENREQSKPADFSVYENHFGALSEHGIFFIQEDRILRKIRSTKLDIPYSSVEHHSEPFKHYVRAGSLPALT